MKDHQKIEASQAQYKSLNQKLEKKVKDQKEIISNFRGIQEKLANQTVTGTPKVVISNKMIEDAFKDFKQDSSDKKSDRQKFRRSIK